MAGSGPRGGGNGKHAGPPMSRQPPPIVALTLNPTVDVTYQLDHLVADQKVHARSNRYDPGGNGINVARALYRLQRPAHSVHVIAGEIGALLERLLKGTIEHCHSITVEGETRINVTLIQRSPAAQFEISGLGPTIPEHTLEHVTAELLRLTGTGYAILTGSLPPGVPHEYYARVVARLHREGARAVVDAQPQILSQVIPQRPFLVKPNRYELSRLAGQPLDDKAALLAEARRLHERGASHVCVSLAASGALLVAPQGIWYGAAPEVAVNSTVGAGDSMVAGLVTALAGGSPPTDALRLGLACGSASAAQPGTELLDYAHMQQLLSNITIRPISAAGDLPDLLCAAPVGID